MKPMHACIAAVSFVALGACSGGGGAGGGAGVDEGFDFGAPEFLETITAEPERSLIEEVRALDVSSFSAMDPADMPSTAVLRGAVYHQPRTFEGFESPRAFGANVVLPVDFSSSAVMNLNARDEEGAFLRSVVHVYELTCPGGGCESDPSGYELGDVIDTWGMLNANVLSLRGQRDEVNRTTQPLNADSTVIFGSSISNNSQRVAGVLYNAYTFHTNPDATALVAIEDGKLTIVGEAAGTYRAILDLFFDEDDILQSDPEIFFGATDVRFKITE